MLFRECPKGVTWADCPQPAVSERHSRYSRYTVLRPVVLRTRSATGYRLGCLQAEQPMLRKGSVAPKLHKCRDQS